MVWFPIRRVSSRSARARRRRQGSLRQRGRTGLRNWETLGLGMGEALAAAESLEARAMMAADLAISITDAHVFYLPGSQIEYKVVVENLSTTETATNAKVTTALAAGLSAVKWSAAYTTDSLGAATGDGNLSDVEISLQPQGKATFTISGTTSSVATGPLASLASVSLAGETATKNNSALDTNWFRPLAVTDDIGRNSTSTVRLVNPETGAIIRSFDAYEPGFRGGVQAAIGDLDGNGSLEIVTAPGRGRVGEIRVFTTEGVELRQYRTLPFGANWKGGVNLAVGDVNGDGRDDIAAAMASGRGDVRVFLSVAGADPISDAPFRAFSPFAAGYGGGATVALADMGTFTNPGASDASRPDGKAELIIGSGPSIAPSVQVYDVASTRLLDTIRPFSPDRKGGVNVAASRVNGDLIPDLIISEGRSSRPTTEVYDGRMGAAASVKLASYQAFAALGRSVSSSFGSAIELTGDGRATSLLAAQGYGGASGLKTVSLAGSVGGGLGSFNAPVRFGASAAELPTFTQMPSGVQYRDLVVGSGAAVANASSTVRMNYRGTYLNDVEGTAAGATGAAVKRLAGEQFDAGSLDMSLGGLIPGWQEAVPGMKVGGIRQLIIPAASAYGSSGKAVGGSTSIPPNADLVFDIELLATS